MRWVGWEDPETFKMYSKMGRAEITALTRRLPPPEALELDKLLTA
jgi:hypothetical protein